MTDFVNTRSMLTLELSGAALSWAVAEALKPQVKHPERFCIGVFGPVFGKSYWHPCWGSRKFDPTSDWKNAGWVLERIQGLQLKHRLDSNRESQYQAEIHNQDGDWVAFGPTMLVAVMRCYVASKLGYRVDVPMELVT